MSEPARTVKVTRADLYAAQEAKDKHRREHKCRAGQGCPEYVRLILAKNALAVHWNEPLDAPVPANAYM